MVDMRSSEGKLEASARSSNILLVSLEGRKVAPTKFLQNSLMKKGRQLGNGTIPRAANP